MERLCTANPPVQARAYPLVSLVAAACAGVALDRCAAIPPLAWGTGLLLALLAWWGTYRRGVVRWAACLVLLSVSSLAGLWHHHRWWLVAEDEIARFATDVPQPAWLRVVALEPPRVRPAEAPSPLSTLVHDETASLVVQVVAMRQRTTWQRVSGSATLLVPGALRDVYRGDLLEIGAMLVRVRSPANPGEPDLAAQRRRSRQLAALHCRHAGCVKRLDAGSPWSLLRQLGRLRVGAERVLDRYVAAPQSPLAAALLLGSRERLPRATLHVFFVSGTIHLLAISGLHVGILASVFWVLLRLEWSPRRRRCWFVLTVMVVIAYALLTGARPPVVRAAVLIVVYCLARSTGRRAVAWNSLAAAGVITLALSPGGLFDIGTQLSFLAVAVLVSQWRTPQVSPTLDPRIRLVRQGRPGWWRLARRVGVAGVQLVSMSCMVWLISLPLVTHYFHLVPLVGLLLNVLLWLPIALGLFSAVAVLACAPVPPLAAAAGWVCAQTLALTQWLTTLGASLPGSHVWVAGPADWLTIAFYVWLIASRSARFRAAPGWKWGLLAVWITVCVASSGTGARVWRSVRGQPLRISFMAVGHGLSVLLELPDGRAVLYDAGRMGSPQAAVTPIAARLWQRRVTHLDAMILSHADADHFNAVPELLERFSVGAVYVSAVMFRESSPALCELQSAVHRAGIPLVVLSAGQRWGAGCGVTIEVWHPPRQGCAGGDNSNSMVIWIGSGRHGVLLPGDLEREGLAAMLAENAPRCDVLLAPHHGSRLSRPRDMVAWARPQSVVISAGAAAEAERLLQDFGGQGARVLWTHRDGLVEVLGTPSGLDVRAFRQ